LSIENVILLEFVEDLVLLEFTISFIRLPFVSPTAEAMKREARLSVRGQAAREQCSEIVNIIIENCLILNRR
jgi:hypothetical protein